VHTKAAADGMEFTLDAATLEQLRARGDASAIIDPSAFGESGTGDDQSLMQVDGTSMRIARNWCSWIVQWIPRMLPNITCCQTCARHTGSEVPIFGPKFHSP